MLFAVISQNTLLLHCSLLCSTLDSVYCLAKPCLGLHVLNVLIYFICNSYFVQLSVKMKKSNVSNGPSMESAVKTGNLWNKSAGEVVRNAVSVVM